MAFFDEISKKFSQTGQDVVQKTKDTAEIMKLNKAISDEQKLLDGFYSDLGKAYYAAHPEDFEADFEGIVENIKKSLAAVTEYNDRIKTLKGVAVCPNCGTDVDPQSAFCSNCGQSIPKAAPAPAPAAAAVCTCGAPLPEGSRFCTVCGKKIETPDTAAAPAAPVVMSCPSCGVTVDSDMSFCVVCGTKLK